MKKRIGFLLLIAVSLFLLMGLMVVSAEEEMPRQTMVPAVLWSLPPVQNGQSPEPPVKEMQLPMNIEPNCVNSLCSRPLQAPVTDCNGMPVLGRCYYHAAYMAFRLEDSGG